MFLVWCRSCDVVYDGCTQCCNAIDHIPYEETSKKTFEIYSNEA